MSTTTTVPTEEQLLAEEREDSWHGTEFGLCDFCCEAGRFQDATTERRLPGGVFVSVCKAHAYRIDSRRAR